MPSHGTDKQHFSLSVFNGILAIILQKGARVNYQFLMYICQWEFSASIWLP